MLLGRARELSDIVEALGIPLYASFRNTTTQANVQGMVFHPDEWYTQTYTRAWLGPK